jgi:hypothetical protein
MLSIAEMHMALLIYELMNMEHRRIDADTGKPTYLEKTCPSAFSITNPTRTGLALSPYLHGDTSVTSHLSHSTVSITLLGHACGGVLV